MQLKENPVIVQSAWRVFNLSMRRVGVHCPQWARTSKFRRKFLGIYKKAQIKNLVHGRKYGSTWQVDHIIPLHGKDVCGLHVPWNLKVIPAIINSAKGVMIVEEYGLTAFPPGEEPESLPWGGRFPNLKKKV